jgi:uncharacterized membrane protein
LIQANIGREPIGNAASIVVLLGMLYVGAVAAVRFPELTDGAASRIPEWVTPVICLMGLGIAGYLSYVEVVRVEAFCGPVGDCNTVQQSQFARLFGIFPIGVIGYLMIMCA